MVLKLFKEVKRLVEIEQKYTRTILSKLAYIEKNKSYADLKYPSLHRYLIKELGYSEAEATLRVNVVRLMNRSETAKKDIESGKMSLVNAAEANKATSLIKDEKKQDEIIKKASQTTTREFKHIVQKELKQQRREVLVLHEFRLKKLDKLREKYGKDLSNYELLDLLLEKELKTPAKMQRDRKCQTKNSRSIPKSVKTQIYTGKCANCGTRSNLEYDHVLKFSHGGTNDVSNIQILCRSCNGRKEILARRSGIFA